MNWWMNDLKDQPVLLGSWVFWVIGSIVMHELSHGWAALRAGDTTPRDSGHMTWNPIVHMGWWSVVMFLLLGFAWGSMPIDPSRFRGKYDDAKVSAAGPAMNLALALGCASIFAVAEVFLFQRLPEHVAENLHVFLVVGTATNLFLMFFNLLPIPPLDGAHVLSSFFPSVRQFFSSEKGAIVALVGFILLVGPIGSRIQVFSIQRTADLLDSVTQVISAARPNPRP